MKQYLFIILVFGLIVNKTYGQDILPKDLSEAIAHFENTWTTEEKDNFKLQPEEMAVSDMHFSVGMWIRNNWIRADRDTSLINYFKSFGIKDPDNVSGYILASLHRKLNGKEIDLKGQIEQDIIKNKPVRECEQREIQEALRYYNKYKIGDSIRIIMKVDASERRYTVTCVCPYDDWIYNPKNDLLIKCIIKDKYSKYDSSNVFFKVMIKKMNIPNTFINGENRKVGELVEIPLIGIKIK